MDVKAQRTLWSSTSNAGADDDVQVGALPEDAELEGVIGGAEGGWHELAGGARLRCEPEPPERVVHEDELCIGHHWGLVPIAIMIFPIIFCRLPPPIRIHHLIRRAHRNLLPRIRTQQLLQ